jgi:hypothetical protein
MNQLSRIRALGKLDVAYKNEVKNIEDAYRKSLKAYEKAMEKFILKHITSEANLDNCKCDAWLYLVNEIPSKDWVVNRDIYEQMISEERWRLEDDDE